MDTRAIAILTGLPRQSLDCLDLMKTLLTELASYAATVKSILIPFHEEESLSKGVAFIQTYSHLGAWKIATALDGFPWPTQGTVADLLSTSVEYR